MNNTGSPSWQEQINKNITLALVLPVAIIAKLLVAYFFPPKYFFDSNRILSMALHKPDVIAWEGSYEVTAKLFEYINVAQLTTVLQWSMVIGMLFTCLLFVALLLAPAPDFLQSIFILASVGLLNIYVFTISKDVIQFCFFALVLLVIVLPIRSEIVRLLLAVSILAAESIFFRSYYILIAVFALMAYVIMKLYQQYTSSSRVSSQVLKIIVTLVVLYAAVYGALLVASFITPAEFQSLLGVRAGYELVMVDNPYAVTYIQNWIPGDGLAVFMLNYGINALRMMIPLELVFKGAYYLPFFAFQLLITYYIGRILTKIRDIQDTRIMLALCVILGYLLASFTFEPDFGSWVRHEIATFPILALLVVNSYQTISVRGNNVSLDGGE